MRKACDSSHRKSNSMLPTRATSPVVAVLDSEDSIGMVLISLPRTGHCLPARPRPETRQSSSIVGIVTGETSRFFLVKRSSAWIPVLKSFFFTSQGDPLPSLQLSDVKNLKVKVEDWSSPQPKAYLLSDCSEVQEAATDRVIQDFETEAGGSEEESSKALETHVRLNTELLTDVVTLAAMAPDHPRSQKYLRQRCSKLRKSVDSAVESLRGVRSDLYISTQSECKQLLSNVDLLTSDAMTVCSRCRNCAARVTLSCGHVFCSECASRMVTVPVQQGGQTRCSLCQRLLTVTDSRLALLERYEVLKKSQKYAH